MTAQKKIHVIAFDVPFPPNYGGIIDVYYKARVLKKLGYYVVLHAYAYGRGDSEGAKSCCDELYLYRRETGWKKQLSPVPYIVKTRSSEELLARILEDRAPVLFEGLHDTYFLRDARLRDRLKIVRTHNIEHDYYRHLASGARNIKEKIYYLIEACRLEKYEKNLKYADVIAAISPNDHEYLKKYGNSHLIPAFHGNEKVTSLRGSGDFLLYHGKLSVEENEKAALFLVNDVFSKLSSTCVIAGSGPSERLQDAIAKHDNVFLRTGLNSEEMNGLIRDAQVNVLPTFQATGLKLKLLGSLYNGRWCVVNSPMVESTGLEKCCVIADTAEDIIAACERLMNQEFKLSDIQERIENLGSFLDPFENGKKLVKAIEEHEKYSYREIDCAGDKDEWHRY